MEITGLHYEQVFYISHIALHEICTLLGDALNT
jgi:hypothetical protein